jgi:hypothetical protein
MMRLHHACERCDWLGKECPGQRIEGKGLRVVDRMCPKAPKKEK